ncbi:hypothetical protein [Candidatus Accumulibacter sp. ACC003]|uniref:hypothetical protein n=1 Tax=Candidatus Accumulibacter sp. ACC003 TaxID=2823334 RepID=UPI0025C6E2FF|nr:hypothetical protein [Candidatus Accumulibacter sp. ACC003]
MLTRCCISAGLCLSIDDLNTSGSFFVRGLLSIPKVGHTAGVETTTDRCLRRGLPTAVGHGGGRRAWCLAADFNLPGHQSVNHSTYVVPRRRPCR